MRIAVISDIHGNLDAFQAVVADAGAVDAWWCLGDVVGYGAEPNACVELLHALKPAAALPGNHDLAAVGAIPTSDFNPHALASLEWTARTLHPEHAAYLRTLPERLVIDRCTLVHASPRDPIYEYILTAGQARANFAHFTTQFCLVGHTHVPVAYDEHGRQDFARASLAAAAPERNSRFLCNPGSVGQPRDGDPRAAYLLIDDENGWEWRRVPYDVERAAARILAAGLPEIEARRLALGF